jgi:cellulose synthase/poly-beta-1,6-N-acetylglucosamine synthase-like glycosyltransferase
MDSHVSISTNMLSAVKPEVNGKLDPKKISIIIPAYKEAERIGVTLNSLKSYFETSTHIPEVIVVDDGSPDNTVEVVKSFLSEMPYLKLIPLPENRGKGFAVKTGMLTATGHLRLFMDADNSVNISHLEAFLEEYAKGYEVVIGSIELPEARATENNGFARRALSKLSKIPVRLFATPGIYDTQRGFKLFGGAAAEEIFSRQTIDRFGFDIELLVIARARNYHIREIPVIWNNPTGSTVTGGDYIKTFKELARIVTNNLLNKYDRVEKTEDYAVLKFSAEREQKKGKGFMYKGKEFVNHTSLAHKQTALYTLRPTQKWVLALLLFIFAILLIINWHFTLVILLSVLTILYFADLLFNGFLIYQSFTNVPEISVSRYELNKLLEEDLPVYTIFCPLYKEWRVVPQFVEAMEKLEYPKDKLQILFLLEENDGETIQKVKDAKLPSQYEIIIVPHSNPKTKPKAMNYGLQYVRGEYVVIYDAEDVPDADQLLKAIGAFRRLPESTVCIQAKLNFYNVKQNLLTRLFTAEYSLWFDLVLPGLQSCNGPIPLGGTSNHFKTYAIRELSGWDAFNVTEDCDLGIRLSKYGYRTAIVESTTLEEANSDVGNWFNQRSRWIKGYIQTYFVHMRDINAFSSYRDFLDFIMFQANVGGKVLSMFINPFMWIITITYFVFRGQTGGFIESLFPTYILYLGVISLVFGNFLYLYYYMIGCAKRGHEHLIKYIFLVPFYWLAMSIASWRAVYEVIIKPHYWAKTVHGLHLKKLSNEVNVFIEDSSIAVI